MIFCSFHFSAIQRFHSINNKQHIVSTVLIFKNFIAPFSTKYEKRANTFQQNGYLDANFVCTPTHTKNMQRAISSCTCPVHFLLLATRQNNGTVKLILYLRRCAFCLFFISFWNSNHVTWNENCLKWLTFFFSERLFITNYWISLLAIKLHIFFTHFQNSCLGFTNQNEKLNARASEVIQFFPFQYTRYQYLNLIYTIHLIFPFIFFVVVVASFDSLA